MKFPYQYHDMNSFCFQVIITTYKVATILEVDVNNQVRNRRKEKALEQISNLLNEEKVNDKPKEVSKHDHDDSHSGSSDSDDKHHKKQEKRKKKKRKKKHK